MKHKFRELDLSPAAKGTEFCSSCGLIKNPKNKNSPCVGAAGIRPFQPAKESAIAADGCEAFNECNLKNHICNGKGCLYYVGHR
jgi:hypothetical protein